MGTWAAQICFPHWLLTSLVAAIVPTLLTLSLPLVIGNRVGNPRKALCLGQARPAHVYGRALPVPGKSQIPGPRALPGTCRLVQVFLLWTQDSQAKGGDCDSGRWRPVLTSPTLSSLSPAGSLPLPPTSSSPSSLHRPLYPFCLSIFLSAGISLAPVEGQAQWDQQ